MFEDFIPKIITACIAIIILALIGSAVLGIYLLVGVTVNEAEQYRTCADLCYPHGAEMTYNICYCDESKTQPPRPAEE